MTHTQGLWQAKDENDYVPAQVFAGDYGQPVADVFGNSRDERKANARLIAAAPELLEACKKAMTCGLDSSVRAIVQAAIAKAEGR